MLTNAAIDAEALPEDEEDEFGQTPSGQDELSQLTAEEKEAGRRRHRQQLRKKGFKPSANLAERQRKDEYFNYDKLSDKQKKKAFKKGNPAMKKDSGSVDSMSQLLSAASGSSNIKLTNSAQRVLKLGGDI